MSEQALQFRPCSWSEDHRARIAQKHANSDSNLGSRGLELTYNVLAVSKLFINNPPRWLSGMDVVRVLGLNPQTAYDILYRMEAAEWLSSSRDHAGEGRARLFYRITGKGHQQASTALLFLREACT